MLRFIVFLVYLLFFIPLILITITSVKKKFPEPWRKWRSGIWIALGGTAALSIFLWATGIYTEVLWFKSLGYSSVFWKRLLWSWGLFLVFGALSLLFIWLNAGVVKKFTGYRPLGWQIHFKLVDWASIAFFVFFSIGMGSSMARRWEDILMFLNQVSSGVSDPIFSRDASFYLFSLPVYNFLSGWFLRLVIVTLISIGVLYRFYTRRSYVLSGDRIISPIAGKGIIHSSIIGVVLMAILMWRTFLKIYGLLYSGRGVVFGASYTDVKAQIVAYKIYIAILAIVALAILFSSLTRRWKPILWALGAWFVGWVVVVNVYPAIVQQFSVKPSELDKEAPYIKNNIKYTRLAYKLDVVEEKPFEFDTLTFEKIEKNRAIIDNIRLWDWRALRSTYKQIQEIRLYYEFDEVDIDRYTLGGRYRQVMLAPRELPVKQLPARSKTWINEHFKYTHGYGLCMNAVNEFTAEGLPNLLIKDMPPVSTYPEIEVKRPEIYYGERTDEHVYVKTTTQEFDYPKGDENVYTTYQGNGGVTIGSWIRKFAFAWRFDGIRVLLSEYLKPESRIMFHRQIRERVTTIAPFLVYDEDPYMVVGDGRLWWIWDAYTVSENYPYSERYRGYPDRLSSINYIRNSVKVVIDAYNGDVTFYIFDEEDPIIRTWRRIFPKLFRDGSEMPSSLMKHIRYPEDFFKIQAYMYSIYHMRDPQVFYNKEDLWETAQEVYFSATQRVLPYYVIVRLPGEEREEFVQIIPLTPTKKHNMIAWMAARCDGDRYGKILVYKFPKEKLIYGPMQIEARIDQNREISEKLTLWGQLGSRVIRGNLLVIPVENSLIYVEPLYIQAEQAQMPELKQVIVAYGDRIVWDESFDGALRRLFLGRTEVKKAAAPGMEEREISLKELIRSATRHFRRYQELTGQGKFVEAAKELEMLGDRLKELRSKVP